MSDYSRDASQLPAQPRPNRSQFRSIAKTSKTNGERISFKTLAAPPHENQQRQALFIPPQLLFQEQEPGPTSDAFPALFSQPLQDTPPLGLQRPEPLTFPGEQQPGSLSWQEQAALLWSKPALPPEIADARSSASRLSLSQPQTLPLPARQETAKELRPHSQELLQQSAYPRAPQAMPSSLPADDSSWEKLATLPMMVLKGISSKHGAPQPQLKSEVSGAAGAAGIVGLGNILGSILKYVSSFLIQYGFGPGGFGLYTLCLSLVNLVSALFNLGLDDAMVRYVAIYRKQKRIQSLQGIVLFCTMLAGIAGIIGAVLLVVWTPSLVSLWIGIKARHLANTAMLERTTSLLQVMAPVVPLMTMQVMWFAGLRGFKAFKWRVLSTNFLQPLCQIALLGLVVFFFRTRDGITAVAVVLFVSTLLSSVLNLYFLLREVRRVATPKPLRYETREWLTFATLNFLTTIIDTVLDSIDTILLAAFGVPDVQLGQYGAAMKLSNFIQMPLLSLSNIFAPMIAELHSSGERQKLETMFKVVAKWSITFSLPLFLIMVLFAPYLLAIPGKGFAPAWPLLIAFALGSMINAGTGTVGYMLLMTGYQRLSFLNSLVAVAVNVGLGIVLTPRYGAMGTAISTGLAICALNLMRVLQVRILLKMHPWRWDTLKPLAAAGISSCLVGGALYLFSLSHVPAAAKIGHALLSAQLLLIPVFLALYIGLLVLLKGSPEDEIVLQAVRKKFLRGKGKRKKR